MDELIDILDSEGNPTGETTMKSVAHREGLYHPTVHVWFYTKNGKVLLQQRGKNKETHPLLWDVSVAGHVGAGEEIEESAIREVAEEIGLSIHRNDLEKIGVFKSVHRHSEQMIDREFHHTFLCELSVPLSTLKKQDSEVETLELFSLLQFSEETWGLANVQRYVPHGKPYYSTVIQEIKKRL
ncbi:NUDIX domain-containing protein [Flavobacteriaceae bacterium TP-CH-4]|uniref:NUDIX domain-containing protein n=1 Tax=Pelagihabitans pacificus TaxID=2696054 RepID=A0A967EDH7_9FLAO|nr:NUDIX domain-containing protein [Pelagihabitans pacificus]NHF59343.1 NUDIX domain-containing protein [Pelagihabitans pacificus]